MYTKPEKITRALVLVAPIYDFYFTPHRFSSLGASVLLRMLRSRGIDTDLLSFPLLRKKPASIPLPQELSYLSPFIIENETGKTSFFTRYKRFGPDLKECGKIAAALKPDICFISCFAFCYGQTAIELAIEIKRQISSCTIAIGGAGVSAYSEYFLKSESIDFTISGEAEVALFPFLDFLQNSEADPLSVPNLGWKNEGKLHFAAKELSSEKQIEMTVYFSNSINNLQLNQREYFITTSLSRGCPMNCRFCSNWICHGREFRRVTFDKVQESIEQLKEHISPSESVYVNFEDDNLLLDYKYWIECIKEFKSHFPRSSFYAENGIDYRLLTPLRCRELIDSGMSQLNFSIGSADDNILKENNRKSDISLYDKLLSIAEEADIPVITYFICGFPHDTRETVINNLHFLLNRKTGIGISMFYAVPGIDGFEEKKIFDRLSPALCAGSSAYPWNDSLSTCTLVTAFRLARFINLCKSEIKSEPEQELIKLATENKRLYTFVKTEAGANLRETINQDYELTELFFNRKIAGSPAA